MKSRLIRIVAALIIAGMVSNTAVCHAIVPFKGAKKVVQAERAYIYQGSTGPLVTKCADSPKSNLVIEKASDGSIVISECSEKK